MDSNSDESRHKTKNSFHLFVSLSVTSVTLDETRLLVYRHMVDLADRRTSHDLWKELKATIPKDVFRKLYVMEPFSEKK